jgi:hypothetical protein
MKYSKRSEPSKHVDTRKKLRQLVRLSILRILKLHNAKLLMGNVSVAESIEYGNVVHEILSFVKTKNDVELAIEKQSKVD